MQNTILLLGPAIRCTNYEREFHVEASTPAEAVSLLCRKFPDLRRFIYEDAGQFRTYLRFFIDSEACTCEAMHEPPNRESIEICVTVPVAGG
jgi:predicted phage tail protein